VRVRAIDAAGHVSPTVTARWILDRAAPSAPYHLSARDITLASRHTFRWGAYDADTSVSSYDLRWSKTKQTASHVSHAWHRRYGVKARSVRLPVTRGKVTCLQVRARDRAGNVSGWSRRNCVARPYDDRALRRSGTTKKLRNKHFYGRSATRLSGNGRLTLRGVEKGSVVWVVLHQYPRSGAGVVKIPGQGTNRLIGLRGPKRFRVVEGLRDQLALRDGRVQVVSTRGAQVVLDGLAVVPWWAR
jgi:hypothetical protein